MKNNKSIHSTNQENPISPDSNTQMTENEEREIQELQKTFSPYFYNIEKKDGLFIVTVPGGFGIKTPSPTEENYVFTGKIVATEQKTFKSWTEAKEYYLKTLEQQELELQQKILLLNIGNESISFTDFHAFKPLRHPTENTYPKPEFIKTLFNNHTDKIKQNKSYILTTSEDDYQTKIHSFITDYLNNEGSFIKKNLNIDDINNLTPKKAIDLAHEIVYSLTKYHEDVSNNPNKINTTIPADNMTLIEILQEGLSEKNKEGWKGNAVCRHMAMAVSLIFDNLKQHQINMLQNTYILYETGKNEFNPKRR